MDSQLPISQSRSRRAAPSSGHSRSSARSHLPFSRVNRALNAAGRRFRRLAAVWVRAVPSTTASSCETKRIDSMVRSSFTSGFFLKNWRIAVLEGGPAAEGRAVARHVLAFFGPQAGQGLGVALFEDLDQVLRAARTASRSAARPLSSGAFGWSAASAALRAPAGCGDCPRRRRRRRRRRRPGRRWSTRFFSRSWCGSPWGDRGSHARLPELGRPRSVGRSRRFAPPQMLSYVDGAVRPLGAAQMSAWGRRPALLRGLPPVRQLVPGGL